MATSIGKGAALLGCLALAAAGWLLLTDKPGLRFEYFLLSVDWQGKPIFSDVRRPHVDELADLRGVAATALFSTRWRGWLRVEQAGEHEFALWADSGGYLDFDGTRLLDTLGSRKTHRKRTSIELDRGFHPIDIGLTQRSGDTGLGIEWTAPGGEPVVLPEGVLYARRPLGASRIKRLWTENWPNLVTRFTGTLLLLGPLLALLAAWQRKSGPESAAPLAPLRDFAARISRPLERAIRPSRARNALLLVLLFAITWWLALDWSVATLGGDDAAYIRDSQFGNPRKAFSRPVHLFLLKSFIAIFGRTDAFVGSQICGAFVFAVTVAALAFSVASLGPKLQLRTQALVLFFVFSQSTIIGGLGAAFADYTAMMFVTLALAVAAHQQALEEPPRHHWHALALGLLTLLAFKSKETGLVILVLVAGQLWINGRIDWRRFRSQAIFCLAGLAAVFLALLFRDALGSGDFGRHLQLDRYTGWLSVNARDAPIVRRDIGWFRIIWPAEATGTGLALRNLWLIALATPLVAAIRRLHIERKILYLLPWVYLLMLVGIYNFFRGPLYSERMLIPILPATCFVAAALFFELGIERPAWRDLLRPRFLAPACLILVVLSLVLVPLVFGELDARQLMVPTALGLCLLAGALSYRSRQVPLAVAIVVALTLLAAPFTANLRALSNRFTAQRGEVTLYPLRAFAEELKEIRPLVIPISNELQWPLQMLHRTPSTLAQISLGRPQVRVSIVRDLPDRARLAIGSRAAFNVWRRQNPAIEDTATWDSTEQLVLVRPLEAARSRE